MFDECDKDVFDEFVDFVGRLTRHINPFEGQLGSYRGDWASLRRGSDNFIGIGIGVQEVVRVDRVVV